MAETQFENIELPNGAILTEVPIGTSDEEIKAYALSSGMAVEEDFAPNLDAFMQDIPGFAEGDEVYAEKELEDRALAVLRSQTEAPTFMEEAHLAFDQGSNLISDFNTVLNAALPQAAVSISFEEGSLLPTMRVGMGEEVEALTYDERLQLAASQKQASVQEEHADTLTKQQIFGVDAVASGVGSITKALLDPTTALPVGQSLKAMTAIGGGVGFTAGLGSMATKNEFDAATLAGYTVAGVVLPAAITRGGQLIQKAPKTQLLSQAKTRMDNAAKAITKVFDSRTDVQKSADAANNVITKMDEEAARLVVAGRTDDEILPLVKANLGLTDKQVLTAMADADRPWTIPAKGDADEILKQIDNPLYNQSVIGRKVDAIIRPISSRIGEYSKPLMVALREVDRKVHQRKGELSNEFVDFFNVGMRQSKAGNPNWIALENALFNNNYAKATQIAEEYFPELASTLPKINNTLRSMFDELQEAGVKVRFQDDYFPRSVKDREGLMQALGTKTKSYITKALEAERVRIGKTKGDKKQYVLSAEEEADTINKVLMGYRPTPTGMQRLKATREIPFLEENLQRFYHSAPESLQMYLNKAVQEVEKRRFFGKDGRVKEGSDDLDYNSSAGALIARETSNLSQDAMNDLQNLISARFDGEDLKMGKVTSIGRDLQYMSLLAQIDSAAVQLGDVGSAVYLNGFRNVFEGFKGKQLDAEDIGIINNVAAEMNSGGGLSKLLDKTLGLSGFKTVDRIGKNAVINSSLIKYQKMATNSEGRAALEKQWGEVFGNETGALIEELGSKQITDRVKTLIWNDLADVQPIALSELPEKYLTMENGRIFYSLKTYMIKQLDLVRNTAIKDIRSKDKATRLKGVGNLARYGAIMGIGNGSVATVRDYYLSGGDERSVTPTAYADNILNSIMSTAFLNRYTIDKYLAEGKPAEAVVSQIMPAAVGVIDTTVGALSGDPEKLDRAAKNIPVLGKAYFTFLGGGMEKNQEWKDREEAKDSIKLGM